MRKGLLILAVMTLSVVPVFAGVTVYEAGNKKIEIGGRIQLQYHMADPDGGESSDDLFFRRLRPYIKGSVTENWEGKIQFDLGKSSGDNEVAVKDAYLQYKGLDDVKITIGNVKPFFSREFLTSSKKQELVERTFVGDHNYGSPDRALGLHLAGTKMEKKVEWGFSVASAFLDPDAKKLDFDSPVNRSSDWNEGWLLSGRVDFHPLGNLKKEQGDFSGDQKFTIGLAAFTWSNDDDNNTYTDGGLSTSSSKADVDSANGVELSAAYRGNGFSIDVQYNLISADTVDGTFDGGLYTDGTTDLDVFALEGGYMFGANFEVVAGYENLDADRYETAWTRTSVGMNYFWNKYKVKSQLTYRINEDKNGQAGSDEDEIFLQFQYVF